MALRRFVFLALGTLFGIGFVPKFPGTAASAVACLSLLYWWPGDPAVQLAVVAIGSAVAVYVSWECSRILGAGDPRQVVVDELVGVMCSVFLVRLTPLTILTAFLLFRFFDIVKPLGIRWLDKLQGGLGVVADDVLAGVYTSVCIHLLIHAGLI